jgi:hypothetical protein
MYGTFIQKVLDVVQTFQVENGFSKTTARGPLIRSQAISNVHHHHGKELGFCMEANHDYT